MVFKFECFRFLPRQPFERVHAPNHNLPYYCEYPPGVQQKHPGHFRTDAKNLPQSMFSLDSVFHRISFVTTQYFSGTDTIYASYANQLMVLNSSAPNNRNFCKYDEIPCFATNQCIPRNKWCDSTVDCFDSSDETACSCISRLNADKICDGYPDCLNGEDETGCFGCDKFSFSCYSNIEEFTNAHQSTLSMCYSIVEKCDGTEQCLNGKDEKDCSALTKSLGQSPVTFKE